MDLDFLGFLFNGKHSFLDFGIYRTSNGSRYNENMAPALTEKTAEVPGGDGMYYFGTQHKQRQFSVDIAFDNIPEETYREMRKWLNGKEVGELSFDERPYVVYGAKVTGTPTLKTLCFEEDGKRVYKGEGTIQFTSYYPYGHTPTKLFVEKEMTLLKSEYLGSFQGKKPLSFLGVPTEYRIECILSLESGKGGVFSIGRTTYLEKTSDGALKLKDRESVIELQEDANITISWTDSNLTIKVSDIICEYSVGVEATKSVALGSSSSSLKDVQYSYSYEDTIYALEEKDGRVLSSYGNFYTNKGQWAATSGLPTNTPTKIVGDLPAPFIYRKETLNLPEDKTSVTACINSGSEAFFFLSSSKTLST